MSTSLPQKPFVYIVDDQEAVLRTLTIALGRHFRVEVQSNSERAVDEILRKSPDVVILDIKMPNRDGLWVLRQIRSQKLKVPIILNSAYQDTVLPADLQGIYAPFGIVTKNGNLTQLKEMITQAVQSVLGIR